VAFIDHDFYGNPVQDGSVDIGVYEQIGSGVFGDPAKQEELNRAEKERLDEIWEEVKFPIRW
jgi:hypothetical protein